MAKEITALLHSKLITVSTYDFISFNTDMQCHVRISFPFNTYTPGVLFVGQRQMVLIQISFLQLIRFSTVCLQNVL